MLLSLIAWMVAAPAMVKDVNQVLVPQDSHPLVVEGAGDQALVTTNFVRGYCSKVSGCQLLFDPTTGDFTPLGELTNPPTAPLNLPSGLFFSEKFTSSDVGVPHQRTASTSTCLLSGVPCTPMTPAVALASIGTSTVVAFGNQTLVISPNGTTTKLTASNTFVSGATLPTFALLVDNTGQVYSLDSTLTLRSLFIMPSAGASCTALQTRAWCAATGTNGMFPFYLTDGTTEGTVALESGVSSSTNNVVGVYGTSDRPYFIVTGTSENVLWRVNAAGTGADNRSPIQGITGYVEIGDAFFAVLSGNDAELVCDAFSCAGTSGQIDNAIAYMSGALQDYDQHAEIISSPLAYQSLSADTSTAGNQGFVIEDTSIYFFDRAIVPMSVAVSDGTEASTRIIPKSCGGCSLTPTGDMLGVSNNIYFLADDATHGIELWHLDVTGTAVLMADINPGPASSSPFFLGVIGDTLYLSANDGTHGAELYWITNDTLSLINLEPDTNLVGPTQVTALNSGVIYAQDDGVTGNELWFSDGTSAGTNLVLDIQAGAIGSGPQGMTAFGKLALFFADDGINGIEVWKSDGTAAGTERLSQCAPGSAPALVGVGDVAAFYINNGRAFFTASDGTNHQLFVTDGTSVTQLTTLDANHRLRDVAVTPTGVAFAVDVSGEADNDSQLWKSDGGAANEVGPCVGCTGISLAAPTSTSTASHFYYLSPDLANAMTDETEAQIVDANGVLSPKDTNQIVNLGGQLVLLIVPQDLFGQKRVVAVGYDPTANVFSALATATGTDVATYVATSQGKAVFFIGSADLATGDYWISDGTAAGTSIWASAKSIGLASPKSFTTAAAGTLFTANTPTTGRELYTLDKNFNATFVKDIRAGDVDSLIGNITPIGPLNRWILFTADDGVQGGELWVTDASGAKLKQLADIWPGAGGSYPDQITVSGGNVFFTADDQVHGRELWSMPITDLATPPVANAGPDQTITLPNDIALLDGSGSTDDYAISSYAWTETSGDGSIESPKQAGTAVVGLSAGDHTFQLTVTDDEGATNSATTTVHVLPAIAAKLTPTASKKGCGCASDNPSGAMLAALISLFVLRRSRLRTR